LVRVGISSWDNWELHRRLDEELSEIFPPLSAENVSLLSLSEGFFWEKRLKRLQIISSPQEILEGVL